MAAIMDIEKISSFLEITGVEVHTAIQFLQATGWQLEEALQLFLQGNGSDDGTSQPFCVRSGSSEAAMFSSIELGDIRPTGWGDSDDDAELENIAHVHSPMPAIGDNDDDDRERDNIVDVQSPVPAREDGDDDVTEGDNIAVVRSPVPAREDDDCFVADSSGTLGSLYRPPFALMFNGSFEKAKLESTEKDKWLLVNLQCTTEFSSHLLNRDTWSNEAMEQAIIVYFIFWQVQSDMTEGEKVCNYYRLTTLPTILVIDPITGRRIHEWSGMIGAERLLEELQPFLDRSPKEYHKHLREGTQTSKNSMPGTSDVDHKHLTDGTQTSKSLALGTPDIDHKGLSGSTDTFKNNMPELYEDLEFRPLPEKPKVPPLPEEPTADKDLTCRVAIRLPTGKRIQRNFLLTDPIRLLWPFAASQFDEATTRPFRLLRTASGASECWDDNSSISFAESGLSNSLIWFHWI